MVLLVRLCVGRVLCYCLIRCFGVSLLVESFCSVW